MYKNILIISKYEEILGQKIHKQEVYKFSNYMYISFYVFQNIKKNYAKKICKLEV